MFCTYCLLLLLTGILWHVTRPESLCRNQPAQDRHSESPTLSVGLNPERTEFKKLQKSFFSEALFHSKKWSKEWSVIFL